jgi:hypothetical protein
MRLQRLFWALADLLSEREETRRLMKDRRKRRRPPLNQQG